MNSLTENERGILRMLLPDIPEGPRPFAKIAERTGLAEKEVLKCIRSLIARGVVRRLAAVPNDRKLGYAGNAMVVWRIDPEEIDRVGAIAAKQLNISHAYTRRTTPDWPYNFYTMIHAETRKEVISAVDELSVSFGCREYRVLYTLREFTKRPPEYPGLEA